MSVCVCVCVYSAVAGDWSAVVHARLELAASTRRVWLRRRSVRARSLSHRSVHAALIFNLI